MIVSIFGKTRQTRDGKTFPTYTTRLEDSSTGELVTMSVKFTAVGKDGPDVKDCPVNIAVTKENISYSEKILERRDKDGEMILDEVTGLPETFTSRTLWVRDWTPAKKKFVDTSTDRFTFQEDDF